MVLSLRLQLVAYGAGHVVALYDVGHLAALYGARHVVDRHAF